MCAREHEWAAGLARLITQAVTAGFVARAAGKLQDSNPYMQCPGDAAFWWLVGWGAADRELPRVASQGCCRCQSDHRVA